MEKVKHIGILIAIALIWLINGLCCKLLNLVPRHQQIVESILYIQNARALVIVIGLAEFIMTMWVISRIKFKLCGIFQIVIIVIMNVWEFTQAPHLLLWGKWNAAFALLLVLVIYYYYFILNKKYVG